MRTLQLPVSSESHSTFPYPYVSPTCSNSISMTHSLSFSHPFRFNPQYSHSTHKPCSFKFKPFLSCASKSNPTTLDSNDDGDGDDSSGNLLVVEDDDDDDYKESESLAEDGVYIEMMKLEKNSRRIESRISIDAPLDAVWSILTDYERLADFIPGLAVSQLLQKGHNYARLLQIGQQNLAFGIKFNAKGIVDCYEKELETLPSGMKRDIEFKMIEGDFQLFEGKWSILQLCNNSKSFEEAQVQEVTSTLSYIVDVKPKMWLPVRLIEGRLCNEIKSNLTSIRSEALKQAIDRVVHDY